jgi:hypothetical protein
MSRFTFNLYKLKYFGSFFVFLSLFAYVTPGLPDIALSSVLADKYKCCLLPWTTLLPTNFTNFPGHVDSLQVFTCFASLMIIILIAIF